MMVQAYNSDLRFRVIKAATTGMSAHQAAERFGVGVSTAIVWARRYRQSGEAVARPQGKPRGSWLDPIAALILGLVDGGTKDISLAEVAENLARDWDTAIGITAIWTFLDRHGLIFEKKIAHAAEQQRPDILEARQSWLDGQLDLDPEKVIFKLALSLSRR